MKRIATYTFLFIAPLIFVACAPGATDEPEVASDQAGSLSEAATATMAATATEEPGATEMEASPTATVDATATQAPAATEAPPTDSPPSPTAESGENGADVIVNGRTPEGAYFLGRADAPVTIIDYSDFM